MVLLETKLEEVTSRIVSRVWYTDNFEFAFSPSKGKAGEDWRCGIFGIYAPSGMVEQVCLWSSIGGLLASRKLPWCVCGDFNVVLKCEEHQGCVTTPRGMLEFNDFVETNGLVDLPIQGNRFTWFGPGNKCSRIDRILVTSEWQNVNLMGTEWQKLKDTTDHTDLLQRLKGLKGFLKGWNAKMFGNVYFHIQEVSKKIEELDGADPASVDLQQLLVAGTLDMEVNFSKLSFDQSQALEVPFTVQEVRTVIGECDGPKGSEQDFCSFNPEKG
ncbi:hypothetical protein V6N13_148831 [Hibiscus sabdariffa]